LPPISTHINDAKSYYSYIKAIPVICHYVWLFLADHICTSAHLYTIASRYAVHHP